jgi:hypothetical protein
MAGICTSFLLTSDSSWVVLFWTIRVDWAFSMSPTMLGLHTMDMMQEARRLYERRGFIRAPELDFHPAKGVLVKAYCRSLDDSHE